MTFISITLFVFVILLVIAFLFLLIVGFEIFISLSSLKIKDDYEKSKIKKYGTYDDSEN